MDSINYNQIWSHKTENEKWLALKAEVARVKYVSLTDVYTNLSNGGYMMLSFLDRQEKEGFRTRSEYRWKLRAICDEWGNEYKPGDVIVRKIQRPLTDEAGRKYRANAINDFRRRGVFEQKFIEKREFVVDEKGCIDCSYEDAAWFISEYGVSYKDPTQALCGRREETRDECRAPDGSMRKIKYWRFYEVPPDIYETLEPLNKTNYRSKSARKNSGEDMLNGI